MTHGQGDILLVRLNLPKTIHVYYMATIFGPYSPLTSKNTCVKPDPGPIQLTINFTIQEESIMDILTQHLVCLRQLRNTEELLIQVKGFIDIMITDLVHFNMCTSRLEFFFFFTNLALFPKPMRTRGCKVITSTIYLQLLLDIEMLETKMVTTGLVVFKKMAIDHLSDVLYIFLTKGISLFTYLPYN